MAIRVPIKVAIVGPRADRHHTFFARMPTIITECERSDAWDPKWIAPVQNWQGVDRSRRSGTLVDVSGSETSTEKAFLSPTCG